MNDVTFKDINDKLVCMLGEVSGTDSDDRIYSNIIDFWNYELVEGDKGVFKWYSTAFDYWESAANCPVSDDGVLGGFGRLTPADVRGSTGFIRTLRSLHPSLQLTKVADCGAGIGRVTKHFLLPLCGHVDLVEQSPRLLEASIDYIGEEASRTSRICVGLQDFTPEPNTYDMIWIQWVVGHLHDLDFIKFFRNCARGLKENGIIVLKDNIAEDWTFVVDKQDSSVSRSLEYTQLLIQYSGLTLFHSEKQTGFPEELCPVYMMAMRPQAAQQR